MKLILSIFLVYALLLSGCATTNQRVLDTGDETQLQKRNYQSRIFDTGDKEKVLRAVISTLQDLGFIVERADLILGSISGTKLDKQNRARITVSVRKRGTDPVCWSEQMLNSTYNRSKTQNNIKTSFLH